MRSPVNKSIVLFGHGARDPQWAEPMQHLKDLLIAQLPEVQVELAFLELMLPSLPDAVDCLVQSDISHIQVVPIFFGKGGHLKNDFPIIMAQLKEKYPALTIEATTAVGQWDAIWQAIAAEIVQQNQKKTGEKA
jgi:sirohydrochlorin cobaltochelatase